MGSGIEGRSGEWGEKKQQQDETDIAKQLNQTNQCICYLTY